MTRARRAKVRAINRRLSDFATCASLSACSWSFSILPLTVVPLSPHSSLTLWVSSPPDEQQPPLAKHTAMTEDRRAWKARGKVATTTKAITMRPTIAEGLFDLCEIGFIMSKRFI